MQIEKPLANLLKEKQNYDMKDEKEEISIWKITREYFSDIYANFILIFN